MTKYLCDVCNVYEYVVENGDGGLNIPAGTLPADFPDDWECPLCASDKTHMQPV